MSTRIQRPPEPTICSGCRKREASTVCSSCKADKVKAIAREVEADMVAAAEAREGLA